MTVSARTVSARRDFFAKLALLGGLFALGAPGAAKAQGLRKRFVKGERPEQSGYSLAVVTKAPAGRSGSPAIPARLIRPANRLPAISTRRCAKCLPRSGEAWKRPAASFPTW